MKLVVNSAYGYLAAGGELTRFADVHAANEVTRRGRETLAFMCRELAARGVTLLEADTDGVYFAVPEGWGEEDERRVVAEVAALLPPLVHLELEGRYAAMLSHEPKNYALLGYDGTLTLRGVAFRSSRAEPFGEAFLRRALVLLFAGDVGGVRDVYLATLDALRRRELPTFDVSSRVRLTKSPAKYAETRESRRELAYEALLAGGARRGAWASGCACTARRAAAPPWPPRPTRWPPEPPTRATTTWSTTRVLRDTFAARLARALAPADFAAVFAAPTSSPSSRRRRRRCAPCWIRARDYRRATRPAVRRDPGQCAGTRDRFRVPGARPTRYSCRFREVTDCGRRKHRSSRSARRVLRGGP
jgi:DNA polymerase I